MASKRDSDCLDSDANKSKINDSGTGKQGAYDGIKQEGIPFEDCVVAKEPLISCSHARLKYHFHLDENKQLAERTEKELQREALEEEVRQLRKNKKKLQSLAEELVLEADELANKAEKKNDMSLLVKSNALRDKSQQKRKEIEAEDKNIGQLEKKLKLN